MARTPNERQPNPFSVFTEPSRTSTTTSSEIQNLTRTNISRYIKCHCKLPYAEEFRKHYLYYNKYSPAKVWQMVGGNLEEGYGINSPDGVQDTCATRASYALNKSGKLIPSNAPGANMNHADNRRYILSAREMNNYLKQTLGKPDYVLKSSEDFYKLKYAMNHEHLFIMASNKHVAIVTHDYDDGGAARTLGNVWFLPTRKCNCG